MHQLLSICAILLLFTACSTTKPEACCAEPPQAPVEEEIEITPDMGMDIGLDIDPMELLPWMGSYAGTLPCADCEGIETKLTFFKDKSYTLEQRYLGKSSEAVVQTGYIMISPDQTKIHLLGENSEFLQEYKIGNRKLYQLDGDGNRMTGELAARYTLNRE